MIYFDNAATGGFKPSASIDAAKTVMQFLCANPGRSGHRLSVTGEKIILSTRELFAKEFSAQEERVIFTKNCTEALNLAIFGTLQVGGHIITTVYEHNSVLRPLFALKKKGLIELDIVEPQENTPLQNTIKSKIKPNTYLIITTAISNVTGELLPIKEVGDIATTHKLLYIVDAAQGGGHIPLALKNGINMIALAGHKGLRGIMSSGVLVFDENVQIEPILYGGTGTASFDVNMPSSYPERLEAGTLNLPAIASLKEGANYTFSNLDGFSKQLIMNTEIIIEFLHKFDKITCFSKPNPAGIVAFKIIDKPSSEVADILNYKYDIAVRSGLHCAPLYHQYLGTEQDGLIRCSLAPQNSSNEIEHFLKAIQSIITD